MIIPIFQNRKLRFRVVEWLAWDCIGGKWLRVFGNCHQPMKILPNILRENWSFCFFKSLDLLIHKPFTKEQLKQSACSVLSRVRLFATTWSPPGSSDHGILQARILEWVAISSSRGSSQPGDQTRVSFLAGGFFTTEPPGAKLSMLIPLKYTIRKKDNLSPYLVIVIGWRSKNLCLNPSKMFMI